MLDESLLCPLCAQPLSFRETGSASPGFGLVECGRHTYPVLDGIPVIRHGRVPVQEHTTGLEEVPGPAVTELVDLVRAGRGDEALVRLLAFPPRLTFRRRPVPGGRRLLGLPLLRTLALAARRRTVRRLLAEDRTSQTAEQWMRLFYERSQGIDGELLAYFLYRFGQPRHVAALAALTVLPEDGRPVLDLACGFGHLAHSLPGPGRVVGVDRNFFQLWVARHFIAPDAEFVCADAGDPLPFGDGTFSAALCSDAFHLLPDKQLCLREFRRCAPDGPLLLTRVGNRLVEPNEGDELAPDEYLRLVDDLQHVLVDEQELVRSYLENTPAKVDPAGADSRHTKWLTLIAAAQPVQLPPPRPEGTWPHAAAELAVNPLYRARSENGRHELTFQFPSVWYAFENAAMLGYHAPARTVREETLAAVHRGELTPEVADLVERFVVIGLPPRYLEPGTPTSRRKRARAG
ncbi:hypothetical protein GCM10022247_04810 [Allokutzneria multivorans]|uniref:Methyltransferase domain-containing protein n=1 Tax=Allokutzneria multivorans TaxID=1142134 RepID=A0ABP7QXJ4_9PSEU